MPRRKPQPRARKAAAGRRRLSSLAVVAAGTAIAAGLAVGLWLLPAPHRQQPRAPVVAVLPPPIETPHPAPVAPAPPSRAAPPAMPEATLPPALEPAPPPSHADAPPWLRFAQAAPPAEGRAMVAVVIDDLGLDRKGAEQAIRLPAAITLSFMTYAQDLPHLTAAAREAGHEMLLHVPMEPVDAHADPGPNALRIGLDRDETLHRLRWGLDRASGYVGINNHMGSKFTSDAAAMAPVIEELRARGLLFLDSRTAASSAGEAVARQLGVPHAARDVFLDNEGSAAAIAARLVDLEQTAARRGAAIAIGHPHEATLAALAAWIPTLAEKRLVLVPLTAIVRQRGASG
jgi:uncharacterized protein